MNQMSTTDRQPSYFATLSWVAVVLVAVFVYVFPDGGVLNAGFAFDDIHLIVTNESIGEEGSAWSGFTGDYYTTGARSASGELRALGYYRPLSVLSTWIDYSLWKQGARGYHVTNLLFHVLTSLLVFALGRLLVPSRMMVATIGAILFAAHPAHPESVAFISGRVDVLAACFGTAALVAFLRGWRWMSVLAFALALFSKEMAITIPALVFLLARFHGPDERRSWTTATRALFPYAAVAAVYVVVRLVVLGSMGSGADAGPGSVFSRMGTALSTYLVYSVWPPFRFNVEPTVPIASGILLIGRWALVAMTVAATVWLFRRSSWRTVGFGLAWLLITLIPVSQLVPVETFLSERYLYLPTIGGCLAVAALLTRLPVAAAITIASLLTVAYVANTIKRVEPWASNLTFWTAKAALTPNSPEPHSALGLEFALSGQPSAAATAYQEALRLDPGHLEALNNYALLLMEQGLLDTALGPATEAIRINPNYPEGLNTLATIFFNMGRFGDAVGQYRRAVRAKPEYRQAWVNLGNTYITASVPDSAISAYRRAIELERDRDLEVQVARCYAMSGRPEEGLQFLERTGTVEPGSAESLVLQGNLDFLAGNQQAGIASVLRATQASPNMVEAWIELGQMMIATDNPAKAVEAFQRALAIDPDLSVAHNNLGAVEESRGNLDEALRYYQAALRLAPNDALVMRNVAGIMLEMNRPEEAKNLLDRAIPMSRRDALAFFYRGRAHQALQALSPALADYRVAASINPAFADAHYRLGELQFLNREPEAGRQSFELFLKWAQPDDPRRTEVEQLLESSAEGAP